MGSGSYSEDRETMRRYNYLPQPHLIIIIGTQNRTRSLARSFFWARRVRSINVSSIQLKNSQAEKERETMRENRRHLICRHFIAL